MALATAAAIGLGASALGSYLNQRKAGRDAAAANAYGQQTAQGFRGMMQNGPSALDQQGFDLLNAMRAPGSGFNVGQDALMQSLRTDPMAKSNQALQSLIAGGGNAFDTSGLFSALGALDQRNLDQSVAALNAGAPGLGQRFGTATMRAQGDLRERALQDASARNAQIQMQSFGDAQTRLLQAIGQLGGNEQFGAQNRLATAGQLQQGSLAQNQGAAQLLQLLLGSQQGRQAQNVQLAQLAAAAGAPQFAQQGFGNFIAGLGQVAMTPGVFKSNPSDFQSLLGVMGNQGAVGPMPLGMPGGYAGSYVPLQF